MDDWIARNYGYRDADHFRASQPQARADIAALCNALSVLLTDPAIRPAIDPNAYDQARAALAQVGHDVPALTEQERQAWPARRRVYVVQDHLGVVAAYSTLARARALRDRRPGSVIASIEIDQED